MDCSFKTEQGLFNFRVGAIIKKDNKILVVKSSLDDYYYSIGGRVKLHETLENAILREVFEETGINFEIDYLGYIHENFFTFKRTNEKFHEVCFYYVMKNNDNINKINKFNEEEYSNEALVWIDINELDNYYLFPEFLKKEIFNLKNEVRHFVSYE